MPTYRVKKPFTDAEGTHEAGSLIDRPNETEGQRYDLSKMVEYGMLEEAPEESATLVVRAAVKKSRALGQKKK
jgi:hypothetical protein